LQPTTKQLCRNTYLDLLFVTTTKIMASKSQQLPTTYDAQWEIKGRHWLIQIGRNGARVPGKMKKQQAPITACVRQKSAIEHTNTST
jgi:hypothetical protein